MTNTENQTFLICSECGEGRYKAQLTAMQCVHCGHEVTMADILPNLDEGEYLIDTFGGIAVVHGDEQ